MTEGIYDISAVLRVAGGDAVESLLTSAREATSELVVATGSTGVPAIEPLVLATTDGRTSFYTSCSVDRAEAVAAGLADGDLPEPDFTADSDDGTVRPRPEDGPLAVGQPRILAGCGWRRPTDPADYRDAGGFVEADAEDAFAAAEGVVGRGWGDVARDQLIEATWETVSTADGDPAVIVNAHGTDGDRLLVESDPFAVLEGADLAATAVGASEVVIFCAEADERAVETARTAAEGFPGETSIEVVSGPATYKAAEPTMAIEAVEGNHRLEARLRPPGPAEVGLHGRPTLVHTPRTLAQVAARARGDGRDADTRLVTVTGDVEDEATVELSSEETLDTALESTAVDGSFKAACVGGRFGGLTDTLDVGVDPASLSEADLGTEGTIEVLNDERCTLAFVGKRTQWAAEANCGRCVPCREGSQQLANLLRDVYDGSYDVEKIEELTRVVGESSICDFGRDLPRPVRTAMDVFGAEFEAHAEGDCPAGVCGEAMEVTH